MTRTKARTAQHTTGERGAAASTRFRRLTHRADTAEVVSTSMAANDDDLPTLPSDFRLKPSRNQKRRSKLSQAPETSPLPEEPVAAPTPEPASKPPPPALPKKLRMKRSGQMHEDLTAPSPEGPPQKKETEY